ncbi:MAG: HTH domain-containing protein, partial [Clostridia bacterium]|nr:HTH domain-containing protein [Clostridia bacterium]
MSTKDRVLIRLEEAGPQGVSGEALAKELQVSRAAVWKAIQALRAEGVAIESAPGSGYRLAGPASLSREGILRALEEAGISVDVETFRSIDSTNSEARRRGMEIRRPLLLAADEQTAGRGRQGRSFYSPSLSGVYLTLAMPTRLPLQDAALATQAMAVAAARAV